MNNYESELMEVSDCISGRKLVDENVVASVAILSERLERLKNTSSLFAGVNFSKDVEAIASCSLPTALC